MEIPDNDTNIQIDSRIKVSVSLEATFCTFKLEDYRRRRSLSNMNKFIVLARLALKCG
ncbi:MAG: hypothetical protein F6K22_29710 [Okeania sp. SIO2F4]|uniref:hypothetical protein n=1 Tax=Okeania sp. SIO2F4 TaxID=2607790 RepID=UPI00142B6D4E|nr:hypothetical protein [Okeania sp. SIO2F4]NES06628.1 hypothetical protein [Okeania sp. SIO2F4]